MNNNINSQNPFKPGTNDTLPLQPANIPAEAVACLPVNIENNANSISKAKSTMVRME
jgi:hypothetical protein